LTIKPGGGIIPANSEAAKVAFIADFMARGEFRAKYDPTLNDPAAYVNLLESTAGVTLSNKQALITGLQNGSEMRATVLRKVIESNEVASKFFNEAFVVEDHFGYLRREPGRAVSELGAVAEPDERPAGDRQRVRQFQRVRPEIRPLRPEIFLPCLEKSEMSLLPLRSGRRARAPLLHLYRVANGCDPSWRLSPFLCALA
jgi:hypothetical protein